MRGSPLLQCLIGAIAFALFAIPLVHLTVAQADARLAKSIPPAAAAPETIGARHAIVRVRLAHPPKSFSLKLDGKELFPAAASLLPSPIETELPLTIPKGGIELALAARWPDGTPDTAVTVELEPDEFDVRRETRWSAGLALNEILSFKW